MRRIKLQLQQSFEKPSCVRARPHVIQIVQLAVRAAVHRELPAGALRAGARRVRIVGCTAVSALAARYIVGIGAATWALQAAIA